jgi:hypothetical protein
MEMKMTLSTPSTISRNVSVMSATKPEEVKNASMVTIANDRISSGVKSNAA